MLVIYSFDDAHFRKMSILVGCGARIRELHEEVMYVRVSLRVIMIGSMRAIVQEGCEGDESMIPRLCDNYFWLLSEELFEYLPKDSETLLHCLLCTRECCTEVVDALSFRLQFQ